MLFEMEESSDIAFEFMESLAVVASRSSSFPANQFRPQRERHVFLLCLSFIFIFLNTIVIFKMNDLLQFTL